MQLIGNLNAAWKRRLLQWSIGVMCLMTLTVLQSYDVLPDSLLSSPSSLHSSSHALGADATSASRHLLDTDLRSNANAEFNVPNNFPNDYFDISELRAGAVLLHIFCSLIMFIALSTVSDEYFEPALDKVSKRLGLPEDIAGATIMALGGSAPELAVMFWSVMVSRSDIGLGTVFGSAAFNQLLLLGLIAFTAEPKKLEKWPIARDAFYYMLGLFFLVIVLSQKKVEWYMSLGLLGGYVVYLCLMYFNESLSKFCSERIRLYKKEGWKPPNPIGYKICRACYWIANNIVWNCIIYIAIIANITVVIYNLVTDSENDARSAIDTTCKAIFVAEMVFKLIGLDYICYWTDPFTAFDGFLVYLILIEVVLQSAVADAVRIVRLFRLLRGLRGLRWAKVCIKGFGIKVGEEDEVAENQVADASDNQKPAFKDPSQTPEMELAVMAPEPKVPVKKEEQQCKDDEEEEEGEYNPFLIPTDSLVSIGIWLLSFPIAIAMYFTIPNCRNERWKHGYWYFLTVVMCLAWIFAICWLLVWVTLAIGITLHIRENVMGLCWLALGTSVPDVLQSLSAARKGEQDGAVSGSVGSNVFNVTLAIPLVWFIFSAFVHPGTPVQIISPQIMISILVILVCMALAMLCVHFGGWKLTVPVGIGCTFFYFVFLLFAVLLESGEI